MTFVPSRATVPSFTKPIFRGSCTTSTNSLPNVFRCGWRKRLTVRESGRLPAAGARGARSSISLANGLRDRDLRRRVASLLGVGLEDDSVSQMTDDPRRLRRKGLICRRVGTRRYFATPYGWKVARLFSRLEARVFRRAMVVFGENRNGPPPTLAAALQRVDRQLDALIDNAVPDRKAAGKLDTFVQMSTGSDS